jgi:hypothetical protein
MIEPRSPTLYPFLALQSKFALRDAADIDFLRSQDGSTQRGN